jgi:hypothetical protein
MIDDSRPPPIALDYAQPPTFFRGEYRTRTLATLLTAILAGTIGLAGVAAGQLLAGHVDDGTRRAASWVGAAMLCVAGWAGWNWGRDATHVVRLNGDGVEADGRLWPWSRVRAVGGLRVSGGIQLTVDVRGDLALWLNGRLAALPTITVAAYDELRVELDHYVRTRGFEVKTSEARRPST